MSREEVAEASDISRSLAAYHLDRLATQALLTVTHERRSGRSGPGAGRPAKMYAVALSELSVSVPPRDYGLAARMLADAAAADESGQTRQALEQAADRLGHEIGREAGETELTEVLRRRGYEPYVGEEEGDAVLLRNCPFHTVARRHPEVVCAMNLALLAGLAAELPDHVEASLEPSPGRCCVALRASR